MARAIALQHDNLSSNPQPHVKNLDMAEHACNTTLENQHGEILGAHWQVTWSNGDCPVKREILLRAVMQDTQYLPLAS